MPPSPWAQAFGAELHGTDPTIAGHSDQLTGGKAGYGYASDVSDGQNSTDAGYGLDWSVFDLG
jgi:hypothetical protein